MSGTAAPTPGFLAGLVPSFSRALRSSLPGRRLIVLLAVLSVGPLLAIAVPGGNEVRQGRALMNIVALVYLQFLAPITGLIFGMSVLQQEAGAGNLPYLFTRPVPRSSILVGRYLASVLVGAGAVGLSLALTLILMNGANVPEKFPARAMEACLLAIPAYVAIFAALSAVTKWALVVGFLYTFGVEGFLGFIPGMLRTWTLLYYTRALTGAEPQKAESVISLLLGEQPPPSAATCVTVLLAVTLIGIVVLAVLTRLKEFAQREVGTV